MRRKRHWWNDYNFYAPLLWFRDWLITKKKIIKKIFIKATGIAMGIWIASVMPYTINEIVANYQSEQELKKMVAAQIQREVMLKEQRYLEAIHKAEQDKKHNEELKKLEEQKRLQEIEDEIKESFGVGDYVIITWWHKDLNGPIPPEGNSGAGQILKIKGEYVYGTWGEEALLYGRDHWGVCSKKDYLDYRAKEQKARDRKNHKTKHKSWGLHPQTVKTSSVGKKIIDKDEQKNINDNQYMTLFKTGLQGQDLRDVQFRESEKNWNFKPNKNTKYINCKKENKTKCQVCKKILKDEGYTNLEYMADGKYFCKEHKQDDMFLIGVR